MAAVCHCRFGCGCRCWVIACLPLLPLLVSCCRGRAAIHSALPLPCCCHRRFCRIAVLPLVLLLLCCCCHADAAMLPLWCCSFRCHRCSRVAGGAAAIAAMLPSLSCCCCLLLLVLLHAVLLSLSPCWCWRCRYRCRSCAGLAASVLPCCWCCSGCLHCCPVAIAAVCCCVRCRCCHAAAVAIALRCHAVAVAVCCPRCCRCRAAVASSLLQCCC